MRRKKAKILISILLCGIVFGIAAIYLGNRFSGDHYQIENIDIDASAALILSAMKQTSSRNGIKEWELAAKSAKLMRNENKALLEAIVMTFHLTHGGRINAVADEGILNTETHDVMLSDNVELRYQNNVLTTDGLFYDKKRHIVSSDIGVTMRNGASSLKGDRLMFDLNQNRLTIEGNVEADFYESLLDRFGKESQR